MNAPFNAAVGDTCWPDSTTCAISPKSSFSANTGTGNSAGRRSVAASSFVNSLFRTGFGAVAFTGPDMLSVFKQKRIRPTRSDTWIHDIHASPEYRRDLIASAVKRALSEAAA